MQWEETNCMENEHSRTINQNAKCVINKRTKLSGWYGKRRTKCKQARDKQNKIYRPVVNLIAEVIKLKWHMTFYLQWESELEKLIEWANQNERFRLANNWTWYLIFYETVHAVRYTVSKLVWITGKSWSECFSSWLLKQVSQVQTVFVWPQLDSTDQCKGVRHNICNEVRHNICTATKRIVVYDSSGVTKATCILWHAFPTRRALFLNSCRSQANHTHFLPTHQAVRQPINSQSSTSLFTCMAFRCGRRASINSHTQKGKRTGQIFTLLHAPHAWQIEYSEM